MKFDQDTITKMKAIGVAVVILSFLTFWLYFLPNPIHSSPKEPIIIETDNYIATLQTKNLLKCDTKGCMAHITIVPKDGPKKTDDGRELCVCVCDVVPMMTDAKVDGTIDVLDKRNAPVDHPLRKLTLDEVQKIYNELLAKEAQAVEATE